MAEHPDLQDEQEFLDRAFDGLEFMRGEARQMLEGVLDLGKGGTFQSRTERDIVVRTSLARLEQLDIGDQALYFGRIDRLPEPEPERESEDDDTTAPEFATATEFTSADVVRHRLVSEIVDAYARHEEPGLRLNRAERRAPSARSRR